MSGKVPALIDEVLEDYPLHARKTILAMRDIMFSTAAGSKDIGKLTETLKWGQPAYLTEETKSGSTVRLAYNEKTQTCNAYFHCQSRLVDAFRSRYAGKMTFEGNRAILFEPGAPLPVEALSDCFNLALTYHLIKNDEMAL